MIKANPKDAVIRRQIESVEFGYVQLFFYLLTLCSSVLYSFLESISPLRKRRSFELLVRQLFFRDVPPALCDPFLDYLVLSTPRTESLY